VTEKIKVRAVAGRMMPHPAGAGRFVGMRNALPDDAADIEIPGGRRYVLVPFEELPTSAFLRRALARGDIALHTSDTPEESTAKAAASRTAESKAKAPPRSKGDEA